MIGGGNLFCGIALLCYANFVAPSIPEPELDVDKVITILGLEINDSEEYTFSYPEAEVFYSIDECTEQGCNEHLAITFKKPEGWGEGVLAGSVIIDGDLENQITFDCGKKRLDSMYSCSRDRVRFKFNAGERALYTIETQGDVYTGEFDIEFEEFYPNGESCEPVCYNAEHTVILAH